MNAKPSFIDMLRYRIMIWKEQREVAKVAGKGFRLKVLDQMIGAVNRKKVMKQTMDKLNRLG